MVGVGDTVPAVTVYAAPGDAVRLDELAATSTVFFLFYLFDWSGT